MSEQNIETLRSIYAEWGRGNWRPKFEFYDAEMEWGWSDEFPESAGVYRDSAEQNQRLRQWLSSWEHWQAEADEFIESGDDIVALARYIGRGKGSGVDIVTEGAHVWKFRNGKVMRLEIFADRTRALESIGLTKRETD